MSISVSINSINRPRRGRFGKKTKNEFDIENQKYMNVDFSKVDGFAEIFPEDKHLIVQLLQNKGFIVGMTGDGANVHNVLLELSRLTILTVIMIDDRLLITVGCACLEAS